MIILAPLLIGHVTRSMRSELLALNMGKCNFEALYLRKKCKVLHLGHDNNKATKLHLPMLKVKSSLRMLRVT